MRYNHHPVTLQVRLPRHALAPSEHLPEFSCVAFRMILIEMKTVHIRTNGNLPDAQPLSSPSLVTHQTCRALPLYRHRFPLRRFVLLTSCFEDALRAHEAVSIAFLVGLGV